MKFVMSYFSVGLDMYFTIDTGMNYLIPKFLHIRIFPIALFPVNCLLAHTSERYKEFAACFRDDKWILFRDNLIVINNLGGVLSQRDSNCLIELNLAAGFTPKIVIQDKQASFYARAL